MSNVDKMMVWVLPPVELGRKDGAVTQSADAVDGDAGDTVEK